MASSGIINGNQSGTQPYLRLAWNIVSQDIPNNRSRVRLQLILVSPYSLHFSASKTGSNNGSSFTYTGGFSGTGTRTLNTREIWVNHNSDGTRSQSVSGSFNIAVSWSGSQLNTISVSGSMNLDTIPRASEITAFSMGGSLQESSSNLVNVRLNVYSESFRFDVSLRYGSTTIATWNNQNFSHNSSRSLSLSSTQVNNLLSVMRNTSSGTVTIRVQTKSGSAGNNIGSLQTRNATANVHSNVHPFSSQPSASISGSGRDSTINRYVQNVSRVAMSASTFTAGYGATITSRTLIIRHSSGTQVERSEHNGTSATSPTLRRSGTYNIYSQITDSRGRSYTSGARQITVQEYAEPVIRGFRADRLEATPTSVDIRREGNHSSLGGLNPADIVASYRTLNGNWQEISHASLPNHTSDSFGATPTSTGHSVTESFEFRLLVTDSFNNTAEATATVSTQRVVLDVHKNEGVGVGKIHERGVLDVDGEAHFAGDLFVNGTNLSRLVSFASAEGIPTPIEDTSTFWQSLPQGSYFVGQNQIPNQPSSWGIMVHTTQNFGSGSDFTTMWYSQSSGRIFRKSGNRTVNTSWLQIDSSSGSNSNGNWVRMGDGTQMCWYRQFRIETDPASSSRLSGVWVFPMSFVDHSDLSITGTRRSNHGSRYQVESVVGVSPDNPSQATVRMYWHQGAYSSSNAALVNVIAIGRWK